MNRIKQLRLERGIKQAKLAEYLNIAQNTLSYWEAGKYDIDINSLKKLADYFNTTTDYILGLSNNPIMPNNMVTEDSAWRQFMELSNLSDDSRKDLEKYFKLLKLADKAKNMNNEMETEMRFKPKYQN